MAPILPVDDDSPGPHRPYKQPFGDAVGKWVVRCPCGCLYREAQTEQEADELVDAAREVRPDVD